MSTWLNKSEMYRCGGFFGLFLVFAQAAYADVPQGAYVLNDAGVEAMRRIIPGCEEGHVSEYGKNVTSRDWQNVFDKFDKALEIDPTFKLARQNSAIAHNNFALYLMHEHQVDSSLREFHRSLYIEPDLTTTENMNQLIRSIGKDPHSFSDRVELGDKSRAEADFEGAVIEYRAALEIKDDRKTRQKLMEISHRRK